MLPSLEVLGFAKGYPEISQAMTLLYTDQYHPPFELFDLENDPWEQTNLADAVYHAKTRDDLARRLQDWMTETGDPLLDGPMPQGTYSHWMRAFKSI